MGKRALHAPSIVGGFCRLPELPSAVGSVVPDGCPLVHVAVRAPLVAMREDAQNDHKLATTRDEPGAVEPVEKWPRYVVQALPLHVGRSVEPAR